MDEGGKKGGRDGGRKKERFLNGYGILLPAGLSLKKKKTHKKTLHYFIFVFLCET